MLHLKGHLKKASKDLINRRNGQGPKHLKFFLLVFSKDEAQAQEAQAQPRRSKVKVLGDEHHWMSLFVISFIVFVVEHKRKV